MASPDSQFEEMAREAAASVAAARAAGEQLTFLPDEPAPGEGDRAVRGRGKVQSQLREWLAQQGMRLPEQVLAEMAGLAGSQDAYLAAMARTEQLLLWAFHGDKAGKTPTAAQRLDAFRFIFTAQLRAAEALLPYGTPKAGTETPQQVVVPVVMPAPAHQVPPMRDVTPIAGQTGALAAPQGRRFGPPPMPSEMQQNQRLADPPGSVTDGA